MISGRFKMTLRSMAACAAMFSLVSATAALAGQGDPIGGVGVSVESIPGGIVVSQTQTDASGLAIATGVGPGSYRLSFHGNGVSGMKAKIIVTSGGAMLMTAQVTCEVGVTDCGPRREFKVPEGTTAPLTITLHWIHER
jgi:hypothetical protein